MPLWTLTDSQKGQPKYFKIGQIEAINITAGGTGYTDGASVTIAAPPAGGVQAVATIVATGGVITGINLTNPGAGYTTAPSCTVSGGTGGTLSSVIAVGKPGNAVNSDIVFVSVEEIAIAGNRAKGIRIPGWNKVTQKMDFEGNITYKVEPLVSVSAVSALNANATDAKGDDLVVADVAIAITVQPVAASVTAPATANFTVTATGASLTYQWQVRPAAGGAYANVSTGTGGTTASYTTAATVTGDDGKYYRCVVSNAAGTAQVTSRGVRLTVA